MVEKNATAFLGLGGNLGNPIQTMSAALQNLDSKKDISVKTVSSLYRTKPWGKIDQPDFLNIVVQIETWRNPKDLLKQCLEVEQALKRVRDERWGPRIIDIDLLLYDSQHINMEGLQVPHPRMLERAFVLVPLAEIAPDIIIEGKNITTWLKYIEADCIYKISADGSWWKNKDLCSYI